MNEKNGALSRALYAMGVARQAVSSADIVRIVILTCIFLLFSAQRSYANMGTPLMWLSAGHLIFGNCLIGVVEGLAIVLVFRAPLVRSVPIMVLANYVSMIAGVLAIELLDDWLSSILSIDNLQFSVIALLVTLIALTILFEWTFVWWILRGKERRRFRATIACLLVNVVSYAVLIPLYASVSGASLISDVDVEDVSHMEHPVKALIYFIDENERTVCCIRPDGSERHVLTSLDESMFDPNLAFCSEGRKRAIALRWLVNGERNNVGQKLVVVDSAMMIVNQYETCDSIDWRRSLAVSDLRIEGERPWDVKTGFWAISGLSAINEATGEELRLTLDTPLLTWRFSHATVLPGEQVICQMGRQVVLVDLDGRQIGLIAFGTSPIVEIAR